MVLVVREYEAGWSEFFLASEDVEIPVSVGDLRFEGGDPSVAREVGRVECFDGIRWRFVEASPEAVWALATELGYRPSQISRRLAVFDRKLDRLEEMLSGTLP